jgi:hypothetical protein
MKQSNLICDCILVFCPENKLQYQMRLDRLLNDAMRSVPGYLAVVWRTGSLSQPIGSAKLYHAIPDADHAAQIWIIAMWSKWSSRIICPGLLNFFPGHNTRSHLKIRILVQNQGGAEFQPAGILMYVEDLKRGPNIEFGPKDFFEIASNDLRELPNSIVLVQTLPGSFIMTGFSGSLPWSC